MTASMQIFAGIIITLLLIVLIARVIPSPNIELPVKVTNLTLNTWPVADTDGEFQYVMTWFVNYHYYTYITYSEFEKDKVFSYLKKGGE